MGSPKEPNKTKITDKEYKNLSKVLIQQSLNKTEIPKIKNREQFLNAFKNQIYDVILNLNFFPKPIKIKYTEEEVKKIQKQNKTGKPVLIIESGPNVRYNITTKEEFKRFTDFLIMQIIKKSDQEVNKYEKDTGKTLEESIKLFKKMNLPINFDDIFFYVMEDKLLSFLKKNYETLKKEANKYKDEIKKQNKDMLKKLNEFKTEIETKKKLEERLKKQDMI